MHGDGLAPALLERLMAYDWPGNVRELRNTIERATILAGTGRWGWSICRRTSGRRAMRRRRRVGWDRPVGGRMQRRRRARADERTGAGGGGHDGG